MKAAITTAQAMNHPDVAATINALSELADKYRQEIESLRKDAALVRQQLIEELVGVDVEPFGLFCGVRNDPPKTKGFWLMLNESADNGSECNLYTAEALAAVRLQERERICAAIKAEDDYCMTEGDYMLDSNDCISVARGTWERPESLGKPPSATKEQSK